MSTENVFIDATPPDHYRCPPLELLDLVSAARWDATEPPHKRLGDPCVVVGIRHGNSESGQMVFIRSPGGKIAFLDRNWLSLIIDFE